MAEKLEDLNLPIAVVTRLVKEALPDGVAITKEARTGLAKVASVFVLYVTSASTNIAKKANRKTVTPPDIFEAMEDIEFDKFIEPLKEAYDSYKQTMKLKKSLSTSATKKKDDVEPTEDSEIIEEVEEVQD